MKKISTLLLTLIAVLQAFSQTRSTFEHFGLPLDSFWNGSDRSHGFTDGHASFNNVYDTTYHSWSGYAYSTKRDTITPGSANQYSAITGSGVHGSATYVVGDAYGDQIIRLGGSALGHQVFGFYVTNATFAYRSMKLGDQFAKKFGGPSGNDPDWFRMTVHGSYQGLAIADSVDVYLADYRSSDNSKDFILNKWQWVDLSRLGNVDSLFIVLNSSDTGQFGMNTPAYFCLDDLITSDGQSRHAPVAAADTAYTHYTDTLTYALRANDSVYNGLSSTVALISGPQVTGAQAHIDSLGRLVYIPQTGVVTNDMITYSLCDELGACDTTTAVIVVYGINGITDQQASRLSISLYPNPAHNMLTISSSVAVSDIQISDISGRILMTSALHSSAATIDISALSPGIYMVRTRSDLGQWSSIFTKE